MTAVLVRHAGDGRPSVWDDPANEALLRRRWADGENLSDIATEVGVSRSVICGQARRIGLPERRHANLELKRVMAKTGRKRQAAPRPPTPPPSPSLEAPPIIEERPALLVPLAAMHDGLCHYISSLPPESACALYCGRPAEPGTAYCAWHGRLMHRAPNPRAVASFARVAMYVGRQR
jgi:hypothetical protein